MKNALHSVLVRNASGEEIPAFAVMVITGTERIDDKTVICIVDKYADPPEVEGEIRLLVNSGKPIGINGDERYGWARVPTQLPGWVLYESGATPEFGDEYGPVDSEWHVSADGTGFHILGLPDTDTERVLATCPAGGDNDCPNNFRVIVVGNPTTGTFDLTLVLPDGSDTLTFNWDDTANEVETAIQFHAHWQVGYTVEASDGPFPMNSISFQLGGDLASVVVVAPTISNITLSGGARSGVRVERACCEEAL